MPPSGSGSLGTLTPIACAIWVKHWNPARRHSRAGTVGAAWGDRARNRAAESITASSAVTQDDSGRGERNRPRGREAVGLSAAPAAHTSQREYRPGKVSMGATPEASGQWG